MVSLIVKATEDCNSNCIYCEGAHKKPGATSLSLSAVACMLERIDEFLTVHSEEQAEILWHGGEPMLRGPGFFSQVNAMQNGICTGTRTRIRHGIQSNLNCLDESFLEPFAELGITSIGTSFDPEPHVRGPGPGIDTDSYNRLFMNGIAVLERNQIPWSLIYVVTRHSLKAPLQVFWLLTNLQLAGSITLNPVIVHDQRLRDISMSPADYAAFLDAVLPVWWTHRHRYPGLEPLSQVARGMKEQDFPIDGLNLGACGPSLRNLEIGADGLVYSIGLPEMGGHRLCGSIATSPLEDALRTNQAFEINSRLSSLASAACTQCPIRRQCHGDTPKEAARERNSFVLPSEWCEARVWLVDRLSRMSNAETGSPASTARP